jgi:hypothetical protein
MARAPRQKAVEQAESLARRIWLAGLGAYGQSLEDAQQHLDRAGGGATVAFEGNPRFDATTLPRNAYLLPDAISATEYTVTMQGADEYAR